MNGRASQSLLERMRNTSSGWGQKDFEHLLEGFGLRKKGRKHDIYTHPSHPDLRITIPRHNSVEDVYARKAVRLIDELIKREQAKENANGKHS